MSTVSDQDALSHALKLRFGLAPSEPTEKQLLGILAHVGSIEHPTDSDWRRAVQVYCPSYETHKYAGLDHGRLNELLRRIQAAAEARAKAIAAAKARRES